MTCRASKRLLLLDYDGTLVDQSAIDNKPNAEVLKVVQGLCADPNNFVYIISGRARTELSHWFDPSVSPLLRQMSCQSTKNNNALDQVRLQELAMAQ